MNSTESAVDKTIAAIFLIAMSWAMGLTYVYGLYDLARKGDFFFFGLGFFFPPYGFVQGLGALIGWW